MKVTLSLSNALVYDLLANIGAEESFDSYVEHLLNERLSTAKFLECDISTAKLAVVEIIKQAELLTNHTLQSVYEDYLNIKWVKLDPSFRKSLGRQFAQESARHADVAEEGERIVRAAGANQQGHALYRVVYKLGPRRVL